MVEEPDWCWRPQQNVASFFKIRWMYDVRRTQKHGGVSCSTCRSLLVSLCPLPLAVLQHVAFRYRCPRRASSELGFSQTPCRFHEKNAKKLSDVLQTRFLWVLIWNLPVSKVKPICFDGSRTIFDNSEAGARLTGWHRPVQRGKGVHVPSLKRHPGPRNHFSLHRFDGLNDWFCFWKNVNLLKILLVDQPQQLGCF